MAFPGGSRGQKLGCERGSGGIFSGTSVAPMFVEVSVALRRATRAILQLVDFCAEGASWIARTVFCVSLALRYNGV